MDKLTSLNAFVAVAERGGFAAAARALGQTRSRVNRAVIALEDALAVQLFHRTTRNVSLTASGRAFYERCRGILADLAEAEREVSAEHGAPRGEIRVNAPMSFGIEHFGPALVEFMRRYPEIRVHLELSDRFVDTVAEGFDITVRIAEPRPTPSLIDHDIVAIRLVICASPGFIASHGEPRRAGDLARLPCLHYGNLASGAGWRLVGPEGPVEVAVNGILCSNNGEVLREAAVGGLGIAMLPTFMAGRDLQAGRLVPLLPDYRLPAPTLTLLYPPNRHLSSRIRMLVEFMHEYFGEHPYWDLDA